MIQAPEEDTDELLDRMEEEQKERRKNKKSRKEEEEEEEEQQEEEEEDDPQLYFHNRVEDIEEKEPLPSEVTSLVEFEEWLALHKLDSFTVVGLHSAKNRTLITKVNIHIDGGSKLALVLVTPLELSLSTSTVLAIPLLGDALNITIDGRGVNFEEIEIVAIGLLWHKFFLGSDSPLAPWINALPVSYESHPLFYGDELISYADKIGGEELVNKLKKHRAGITVSWERVSTNLFNRYKHLFPSSSYNLLNWKWAIATVLSRALTEPAVVSKTGPIVVPYIDFLNHSPDSCWGSDNFAEIGLLEKNSALNIAYYTNVSKAAGQELFRCYGKLTNTESLLNYGFVSENNPYNYVPITFEWTSKHSYLDQFKQQFGQRISGRIYQFAEELPKNLLDVFRLDSMTQSEYDHALYKHIHSENNVPLSVENEYKILRSIAKSLSELTWKYFSTRPPGHDLSDLMGLGLRGPPTGARREMLLYAYYQKILMQDASYNRIPRAWDSLLRRRNEPLRAHLGTFF